MGNATISYQGPSRKLAFAQHILPHRLVSAIQRVRGRKHHPLAIGVINREASGLGGILNGIHDPAASGSVAERLHMIRRVDFGTLNKGVFLRWGITQVDPTVDRRLVEFCLRVPLRQYGHGGISRALIRTALEDHTLQAELPGYADFARQVRYRLFPGIW
jgi:hypothetical protein